MTYYCAHCKKDYKSYQSLWNHNKKFHTTIINTFKQKLNNSSTLDQQNLNQASTAASKTYNCRHCNKNFSFVQARHRHEKTCKIRIEKETKKEQDRIFEEKRLDIELKKREAELLRLKMKTQTETPNTITVQKINKALQNSHNTINNNINNTQNNQLITNNYQIVALGKENIQQFLTDADKKMIINSKRFALQRLVELVHCGKFNQFRNIFITNIKDNYMYKYDDSKHMFSLVPKEETLKTLLGYRLDDLELIYDQLVSDNKVDDKTKRCMERFINEMRDQEEKEYKYEINDIKMLLFNERDKILPDIMDNISLVVSVNEV